MQIYVWLDQSTNKYLKVRNRDVMYLHDISFEKIEKQSKKCQQIKRWVKCIFIQGKHKSISSIIIKLSNKQTENEKSNKGNLYLQPPEQNEKNLVNDCFAYKILANIEMLVKGFTHQ